MRVTLLEDWAGMAVASSGATAVLTPSFCVSTGDRAGLRAVLDATSPAQAIPGLITLVAIEAQVLATAYVTDFLNDLGATPERQLAFVFADKKTPLAKAGRLRGLRAVLSRFPGSWVLGVDALVATDALAHGAGWVAVGASSGCRWPRRPGDSGGGPPAAGFLPGTFLRYLLEFRSPAIYADWFANARSPYCCQCRRNLDSFEATPEDKERIITHNLHAVSDFADEVIARPEPERAAWLHQERVDAFLQHGGLNPRATKVQADPTLRYLCEIDDPLRRRAMLAGRWR